MDTLSGQTLGQYELRELLGIGGMGAVYRGYQPSLDREVAVKVIFTRWAAQDQYRKRFIREARMAASLEHAHIVPVYDFGSENDVHYVVMRLLGGGTLGERILRARKTGPLPLPEVTRITRDLASALQYAHQRSIIHRDIKSSNVMFDDQGMVFLVDFGIAKLANSLPSQLTDGSVRMGTPEFMAPEQWQNKILTPAVDQYALAILVYLMLTSHMPFKGGEPHQFMHSHLHESPTPLTRWRYDLPGGLMAVINRALDKDPDARYPNVEGFAQAFEAAIESASKGQTLALSPENKRAATIILPAAPETPPQAAPRNPKRLGLAAAAVLVAAAVVLFGLLSANGGANPTANAADDPQGTLVAQVSAASATPTETPTEAPTATATHTATATWTASPTPTETPTATDTPTFTLTPSQTTTPTVRPTNTATDLPTTTVTTSPVILAAVSASNPVTISLPVTSLAVGESQVVEAHINCTLQDCQDVDMTIRFDPTILQVSAVEVGPYLGEAAVTRTSLIDNAAGTIHLAAQAAAEATVADDPILLRLTLEGRSPGGTKLLISEVDVTGAQGEPQSVLGVDGIVVVTNTASEQPTCQYRVQTGDTLSGIALANGVTIDQINDLNEIPNRSVIRVGQVLTIPASNCRAPVNSSRAASNGSETIEVYDCRYIGGGVFEWYSARRNYDTSGSPIGDTRTGGPYSGAWRPGCPADPTSNSGSSNNGSSSSGSNNSSSGSSGDEGGNSGLLCILGLC